VVEEITRAFGDDHGNDPAVNALFANQTTMTKVERMPIVRRAFKLVTHPARHRDQVSVALCLQLLYALNSTWVRPFPHPDEVELPLHHPVDGRACNVGGQPRAGATSLPRGELLPGRMEVHRLSTGPI
jgi:hypothetical protein